MSKPCIPPALIDLIVAGGEPLDYPEGSIIFEAGTVEETMYLIQKGRILIRFDGGWGEVEMGINEIFGELALIFENHCRTATAIAAENSRVIRVDRRRYERLADQSPRLMFDMLRNTSAYLLKNEMRLAQRLKATNRSLEQANDYLRRTQTELTARELEARTDSLTGIYNRRCFDEHLMDRVPVENGSASIGVLYVDMDKFKSINDVHGHACGDRVLQAVAGIIRENVRKADLPCRIGGDEFAVLFNDIDEAGARSIGSRIHEDIANHTLPVPYQNLSFSVSIGGAMAGRGEDQEALLRRVDSALYQAKNQGRSQVVWDDNADETFLPGI